MSRLDEYLAPANRENTRRSYESAKRAVPRVARLMLIKLFQRLGSFVRLTDIPEIIRNHIAMHAGVARPPTRLDLQRFEATGSLSASTAALRRYLDVRPANAAGYAWLDHIAETAADTKHAVADIINVMLDELVQHRYELPAFSTLNRCAIRAREKINRVHF